MSFVKKGLLVSVSQILFVLLGIVGSAVHARFLGPAGVGQLALFISALTVAIPVVSLGIGSANTYFLNSMKFSREEIISHSLAASLVLGIVLMALLSATLQRFSAYFGTVPWTVSLAFSFGGACQVLVALLRPILVADLAIGRMVSVNLVQHLVSIVFALALGFLGLLQVRSALYVAALGSFASASLLLCFLGADIFRWQPFRLDWLAKTTVYGLKLATNGTLLTLMYSLTVMIIRHLLPEDFSSLGLYTRAAGIAGLVTLVPMGLGPLLYAKWSDISNENIVDQSERTARFNVLYGVLAAICLVLLGKYFILILYGRAFLAAQEILLIFAPAMVSTCLFTVFNNLLASHGRAAMTTVALAGALAINCSLTYLFVPSFGVRGAAMAVFVGNMFSAVVTGIMCRRLLSIRFHRMLLIRAADIDYLWRAVVKHE